MARTSSFGQPTQTPSNGPRTASISRGRHYRALQEELLKIRSVLANHTLLSQLAGVEPELFPDPADQASADLEQDVALLVKFRASDRLRQIEQALTAMRANMYGICQRCDRTIPLARLQVQPDAQLCVPCQTVVEQEWQTE